MPNDNIMGIPTKACINGLTKEDTERLKNALIKKIEDNETTVNVTEDGKVIVADNSGFYLSYDGNMIGIEQDISGDYIPKTVPYLPEDANENPLAPPNDTIMTSANIVVDPRIVRTTGNQTITGTKNFNKISAPMTHLMSYEYFNTRDYYAVARFSKNAEGYIIITLQKTDGGYCKAMLYAGTTFNLATKILSVNCTGITFRICDDSDSDYCIISVKVPSARNHVMTFEVFNRFCNIPSGFSFIPTPIVYSPTGTPTKDEEVVM